MKFVMSERIKHRLTGAVVILALAILFLPDILKKSNAHFEEQMHVSLLPLHRPAAPKLAIPNQKAMFKAVKVARMNMPKVLNVPKSSLVAKAQSLTPVKTIAPTTVARIEPVVKLSHIVQAPTVAPAAPQTAARTKLISVIASKSSLKPAVNQSLYQVQLAAFMQRKNAELLVNKLRESGYTASYHAFTKNVQGEQQAFYQVLVGKLHQRDAAIQLQQTLASNVKLTGFVVKSSEIG